MKKIQLGTFYGKDMFIETQDDDTFDYSGSYERWIEYEKQSVLEEYKDRKLIRDLEVKSRQEKDKESFAFKLYKKIMQ